MNKSQENAGDKVPKHSRSTVIWLYLIALCLVGTYAAFILPALTGISPEPLSGYGLLFWNWLFFYVLWRHKKRRGWVGGLLGVFIGILGYTISVFIAVLNGAA